ncbi:MAG: amino acid permease [Bradyrhizobiaceae bacterium]|nr:amino acid permease [Bradyrhizobiaceae bacterium]
MSNFTKSLGTLDATMIVAGSMIGSGIFIVSADIARQVGHPVLLLAVWAITGLLTLIAASSYGELAGMMPHAGGQYVYLREAFGPLAGFLYGWTLFTVIQTGTIAAVAMAFAKFTSVLIPQVGEDVIVLQLGGGDGLHLTISAAQLLAIASIVLLTFINTKGVRTGKLVQNVFTSTKVLAVVLLAVGGLVMGTMLTDNFSMPLPSMSVTTLLPMIAAAMVGSIFSSDAWNNITFIAGEVKNAERTIPRGLVYGVVLVTVLYLTTNVAYLNVLPVGDASATGPSATIMHAAKDRVGTAVAEGLLGSSGAIVMAVLIMVSTFGCNNGLILAGARAYWAMATDKLFFKGAASLNQHGVPSTGLWIQAIWASLLCLSGSYGQLLDYVVFAVLIFYVMSILGIFKLRKTQPDAVRPIKAFGYPFVPGAYVIIASGICGVLLYAKPDYTWPGLIIVACGIPVYAIWRYVNAQQGRTR